LKNGLLMLAGGLGLGVVAKQRTAEAATSVASPATAAQLKLHGSGLHLYAPDRKRGATPLLGDRLAATGTLHDTAGNEIGRFHAALFCTGSPHSPGSPPLTYLEQHTFILADGVLFGSGVSGDGTDAFAIVGGTGRYVGARGTYNARQSHYDMGGDGTAEFQLTYTL
jgi:hypothetical protein